MSLTTRKELKKVQSIRKDIANLKTKITSWLVEVNGPDTTLSDIWTTELNQLDTEFSYQEDALLEDVLNGK